jgi:DNA-binding transcriptional LysR family regulator
MSEHPMDTSRLRQYLAVVEHGHFGRAAQALNISQQAMSKAIIKLEQQLKVKLLERGPFGVRATPIGQMLAQRAHLAIHELNSAQAEIQAWRGARIGEVRVGVGLSFVGRLMPVIIERYRQIYPHVHITATVESSAMLFPMVLRGELDMAVSAPPAWMRADEELRQDTLFADVDYLIARAEHPLAGRQQVPLSVLAQYPWLVSAQLGESWQRFCRQFVSLDLEPPRQLVRTDSIGLAKELMLGGDYMCLLSRDTVSRELESGQLTVIDTEWQSEPRTAYLTYVRRDATPPAIARMMKLIRDVCREMRGGG